MKRLVWYVCCCWTLSLVSSAVAHANPRSESSERVPNDSTASLGKVVGADLQLNEKTVVPEGNLAQTPPAPTDTPATTPSSTPPTPTTPASSDRDIQEQLNNIKDNKAPATDKFNTYQPKTSPGFSIFNPTGFGADNNQVFFSVSYQSRTRFGQTSDAEAGFGIGLGDAVNSVGVEINYGINSFGSSSSFGSGSFSAKVHKRLSEDTSVAIGWNQFADVCFGAGRNGTGCVFDYPKGSYYAVGTKIFRTRDDIDAPFSRVAITGGVGSGTFLAFDRTADPTVARGGLNAFGSVGVRIARPVSAIVEWTGQDLGAGISIAPFDNFPLVITPAFRDITGAGDGARFIVGASLAFNF